MDKEGLRRAWGGEPKGEIANHIVPDAMFGGDARRLRSRTRATGNAGNLEEAKAEMAQSKYDTNQDGVCDAPECSGILHVTRNTDVWKNMEPVIESSFNKIGLAVESRELEDSYTVIQTVEQGGSGVVHARLGQGLRRRLDVHGPLRQPQHPAGGQRELLAGRSHVRAGR